MDVKKWKVTLILTDDGIGDDGRIDYFGPDFIRGSLDDMDVCAGVTIKVQRVVDVTPGPLEAWLRRLFDRLLDDQS